MKILQFGRYYPPPFGGIQNVIFEIRSGLIENCIRCDALCSNDRFKHTVESDNEDVVIRTKSFGKIFSTSITPHMIYHLNKIKSEYDIIHVHFPDPIAALALYITRPRSKIVIHWHSDVVKQKHLLKFYEPLQNWVIRRADLIIGSTKNHIRCSDQFQLMGNKSKIIPYPFDLKGKLGVVDYDLVDILKKKYVNKKIILSIGRLVYYKGFQILIDAANYLTDDYVIIIGGSGHLKNNLQNQIDKSNLQNKVILVGSISQQDLPSYYELCDIFCLPSTHRSEMFGIVQLEAMFFGKPVISTKIERSGVCCVNINGNTGICVSPGNSKEISDAVFTLMENSKKYTEFSNNAKTRITEVYDKTIIMKKLITAYSELIEKH